MIFLFINLLMIFCAYLISTHFLRNSYLSEKIVTTCIIYFSQITLTLLFLGLVVQNFNISWIVLLNGMVSTCFIIIFRNKIYLSIIEFLKGVEAFSREIFKSKDILLYIFILMFFAQVVSLLIKIYYLPPHVWDTFAYHLHPIADWYQNNMISTFIETPVTRLNRNPMGSQLLHFWFFKLTNDIRWIELPQFIFGLIVPLTSYSILKKINVGRVHALRYSVLIYFIPLILIESRTCQDHLVLNGLIVISMLYLINIFYEKKSQQLILLSMTLGLLLGTKINSPQVILVFPLALLIGKGWKPRKFFEFFMKNLKMVIWGIILALFMGVYWFVKNPLILNSYIYNAGKINLWKLLIVGIALLIPLLLIKRKFKIAKFSNFFKRTPYIKIFLLLLLIGFLAIGIIKNSGIIKTFVLGYESPTSLLNSPSFYENQPLLKLIRSRFVKNILSFPFRIKDIGLYTSYTPDFLDKSGFGIQFFGFGLIAYIAMTFLWIVKKNIRSKIEGFILVFSVLLLLSYYFYYFSSANYRMFIFFPIFGIILWAYIANTIKFPKLLLYTIDVIVFFMILFNMVTCQFEGNMDENKWKTTFTIDQPLQRTMVKYSFFFKDKEDWELIDQYLCPEEPLGYMGHMDSWVFPYFDNQLKRRIYHLPSLPGFKLRKKNPEFDVLEINPVFLKNLLQKNLRFIHINSQGARQFRKIKKPIIIDDPRFIQITRNLYYFKSKCHPRKMTLMNQGTK